ncbi:MAG: energy transducer TonB [Chitinophagales bacterium]|nr:energy transducer TonB [Chitinophagales bacterium]
MRIYPFYIVAFWLIVGCNQQQPEAKPDAERVITDTLANELLRDFNAMPQQKSIAVQVNAYEQPTSRVQSTEVDKVWQQLKPTPQKFRVNNRLPVTIEGAEGTKISFDAQALVLPNGTAPNGDIDIELYECYQAEDYIRHNLGTIPGGSLLKMRGALSILAFYEKQPLQLSTADDMLVVFPKPVRANQLSHFVGLKNTNGIDWTTTEKWNAKTGRKNLRNTVVAPEFSYNGLPLPDYLAQIVRYPEYAKTNELSGTVNAIIKLDENGKVTDAEVTSGYIVFRDEVKNVLLNMPEWQAAMFGKKNMASAVKIAFDFNLRNATQVRVNYQQKDFQLLAFSSQKNGYQLFDDKNASLYGSLGWVACGNILPSDKNKADVVVQANSFTDIKLFLPALNCLVNAENFIGHSRFKNIPANEQAVVFGVKANGETFMYSLQELSLKKQNVVTPDWKKAGVKDVVNALHKVNS